MFCKNCGKEIDDRAAICIHCGVPTGVIEQNSPVVQQKVNGLGIAGFVIGILSLYLGAYFCVASVVGLVLSIIGMVNKKKCTSCNGLALAGLILSIISLVLWVFVWCLFAAMIFALIGMGA